MQLETNHCALTPPVPQSKGNLEGGQVFGDQTSSHRAKLLQYL